MEKELELLSKEITMDGAELSAVISTSIQSYMEIECGVGMTDEVKNKIRVVTLFTYMPAIFMDHNNG